MASTYRNYFKKSSEQFYIKDNYETAAYCQSKYENSDTNMLSRLRNALLQGINEKGRLPKFIVLVLDDDIIEFLEYAGQGALTLMGQCVEWLCEEFQSMLTLAKESVPLKARKEGYPQLYWVAPPHHKNFLNNRARTKLTNVLETAFKLFKDIRLVRMKEMWNYEDGQLVNGNGEYTGLGWDMYWLSIDAAIKFNAAKREIYVANQICNENINKLKKENAGVKRGINTNDKDEMYRFFKRNKKSSFHKGKNTSKLPTPNFKNF